MAGIGNLKPIKLFFYGTNIDANGDAIETIETTYKMWAEVADNGGSRTQSLGRTEMSDTKTFRVNFRGYLITGNYKIKYFGQTYAVTNIERVDERRFNYVLTGFNIFESSVVEGGGGGGETFQSKTYSDGAVTTASGVFSRFTCSNPIYHQILIDKPFKVKWPNDVVLQYPSANLTANVYDYNGSGTVDIDIYFDPTTTFLTFNVNGGTNVVAPNNLPASLLSLTMICKISSSFTLPVNLTTIDLRFNNINLAIAENLLDQLVTNNINNGTLAINQQLSQTLDLSGLADYNTLISRGWAIS